jgi:membrane fusion protein, macrolide-specific efflux system
METMATSVMMPPRLHSKLAIWSLILGILAVASFGAWRSLRSQGAAGKVGAPGQWVAPEMRDVSTTVSATGTVRLKSGAEVRVGAQLSGIVRRLNVTVGSKVHAGDVIAEIDDRPVQAKIDQAQTQLAQSQVTLAKSRIDSWRMQKLFEAGVTSRQQLDDATAGLAAAQAAVTAAESSLAVAKVDLVYVEIRAPISGTIASVSTLQGETVAASFATPTFVTIIQESALEVVAMVDEADIGNVRPGLSVSFTTETYPDQEFVGTVARVAPIATFVSGVVNYEVALSIGRAVAILKPDMTTNVSIVTAKHRALLIPAACIHQQDGEKFVYIRTSADTSVKRTVTTGARITKDVEITSGLSANNRVLLQRDGGES